MRSGDVWLVTFGHGGSTVVPLNNPAYKASVGSDVIGDFNGDGLTDIVHIVRNVPGVDPYIHVHFSLGNGEFALPTSGWNIRMYANPQGDYNANLGDWTSFHDQATGRDGLVHDPQLPDHRLHYWHSKGNGEFEISDHP